MTFDTLAKYLSKAIIMNKIKLPLQYLPDNIRFSNAEALSTFFVNNFYIIHKDLHNDMFIVRSTFEINEKIKLCITITIHNKNYPSPSYYKLFTFEPETKLTVEEYSIVESVLCAKTFKIDVDNYLWKTLPIRELS